MDEDLLVEESDNISVLKCKKCGKVIGIVEKKEISYYAKVLKKCKHFSWGYIDKKFVDNNSLLFGIIIYHIPFYTIGKNKYYLLYKVKNLR
ncbi:hypothetical protein [Sulfolobus islandicus rod-shaped virus 2]|uniref:Uncharacterized protein n=1 Tax=Sulfolobus islandicus rod-shaped virus 2 TaxID=157899 RepID=Q8V9R4_SIRV2|nr:hypothetical protein SIRV2gp04 [Sulfolobus islandicus rod-shaped virus 2]CAC87279.1 hypothetical protein [Sulfolobus islandicus rod-shaped virus 2]